MTQPPWNQGPSDAQHQRYAGRSTPPALVPPPPKPDYVGPSWKIAIALSLTVGSFGIADFYMGRWVKGLILLALSPFFISSFIAITQGIYWLAKGEAWFQHRYGDLEPVVALPPPRSIEESLESASSNIEGFTHSFRESVQGFLRAVQNDSAPSPTSTDVDAGRWVSLPRHETRYERLVRGEVSLDEYLIED